jgi:hypothetical protein
MTGAEKEDDDEEMTFEDVVRVREELTAMGLIVDSGQRKLNPYTGEWDIC